jgi:transposase
LEANKSSKIIAMRPKGSAEALEVRRRIAANLLAEGRGIREVARLVKASPASVLEWKRALEEGGLEALKPKPHAGRKAKLSLEQRAELEQILLQGPMASGFKTEMWSLPRVAKVIEHHFGVKHHPGHVWKILRAMGWSAQKPERRARERDEAAIERWRKEDWPRLKKKPARKV